MGKFRTFKIRVEFEGYVRITENQDLEVEWSDRLYDETNHVIDNIEIVEEYELNDELINYLENGVDIDEELEKEIDEEITSQKKSIKRENILGEILQ